MRIPGQVLVENNTKKLHRFGLRNWCIFN